METFEFVTTKGLRALDEQALASGVTPVSLMGLAARGVARELIALQEATGRSSEGSCLIFAGPGNNGGDGFGIAHVLHQAGWRTEVWVAASKDRFSGASEHFLRRAQDDGIVLRFLPEEQDWTARSVDLPVVDWVVDSLLGSGSQGEPRGPVAGAVQLIQCMAAEATVLSVDQPTGWDSDKGIPMSASRCVRADYTVTLGCPTLGFEKAGSAAWTGSVSCIDLGFAASPHQQSVVPVDPRAALQRLKLRSYDAHKGSQGHALLIGGSAGMTGAICMAAEAALRSGAGLVTILTPASCAREVDLGVREAMVIAGAENREGLLTADAWQQAQQAMKRIDAILLGPGLRVCNDTETLARNLLFEVDQPVVVDADGINVARGRTQWLFRTRADLVLTPHPGELSGLMGQTIERIQENRIAAAEGAARECDATVVLKGAGTLIAKPGERTRLNLNGNPGLASGGTGDVLAGLLTGLLAQGLSGHDAATLAVHLHGRAGDFAAVRHGHASMLARDVLAALPAAFRR